MDLRAPALHIVCPFIKLKTAERLLRHHPAPIRVITRFNLADFFDGVSDTAALRLLVRRGAEVRGVRNLHAKVYLFGERRVIVTSANLTDAALTRNHEFGFQSDEPTIVARCHEYFTRIWSEAGDNLTIARVDEWERRIFAEQRAGGRPSQRRGLPDEGTSTISRLKMVPPAAGAVHPTVPAHLKFFGRANGRVPLSTDMLENVKDCGSHWAATYPFRPRNVADGDVMFIGRLTSGPDDVMIHGRALALAHRETVDDASSEDLLLRPWKRDFPHYVRLHHAEFVAGTLENGVSLNAAIKALGADVFVTTQEAVEQKRRTKEDINPKRSLRQKPAIRLTPEAHAWINTQLDERFARHGQIPPAVLETLDWPALVESQNNAKTNRTTRTGLSPTARLLLEALLGYLRHPEFNAKIPKTFPSYQQVLVDVGIEPVDGPLGPQFEGPAGGRELNEWLMNSKLPALTGIVVRRGDNVPGAEYFTSNGREPTDYAWWLAEMLRAASFDWSHV